MEHSQERSPKSFGKSEAPLLESATFPRGSSTAPSFGHCPRDGPALVCRLPGKTCEASGPTLLEDCMPPPPQGLAWAPRNELHSICSHARSQAEGDQPGEVKVVNLQLFTIYHYDYSFSDCIYLWQCAPSWGHMIAICHLPSQRAKPVEGNGGKVIKSGLVTPNGQIALQQKLWS